ncbi:MAG: hypothetical protein II685_07075 [Clostridia bacterium]|nr:hypothetical protein [Clostridia bacterium]
MNKRNKEALNMFFSAFMVVAYVICCYFIIQLSSTMTNVTLQTGVTIVLVIFFGVMLFYATRVGDGKQIVRFSPSVLILMVLPSLYAICAFFAVGLPLHTQITENSVIMYLAAVTLGYGLPYTFTSGFEMVDAEDVFYPERSEEMDKQDNKKENKTNKKSNKKK